jgi:hypothetical protein
MGMLPRRLRADTAYAQTQRTVDRQFLFVPNPTIRNIVGASAARAQAKHPVLIFWLEFNINHEQNGIAAVSDAPDHLENLVRFKQTFHRILADELNRLLEREGAVFSSPPRTVECVDEPSLEQQFFYALTNPVKDGLVDHISEWGGFSSYNVLAHGTEERFTYIDRTAWNRASGKRKQLPLQQFTKTAHIEYTPLPQYENMKPHARQAHIRREVRKLEAQFQKEREAAGRKSMGAAALRKLDPRSRPAHPKARTPMPLCHAASKENADAYRECLKAYLVAYRAASAAYRSGAYDTEFPAGAIRPPLIRVCGF